MTLRIGSRASQLARWQARYVEEALRRAWPELSVETVTITTAGDRTLDRALPEIGGKGLFTLEIEEELRAGAIDLAVHSLKDLPTAEPDALTLGAVPLREDPRDVLVSPQGLAFDDLPSGAVIGTSSPRRRSQLLLLRPDIRVDSIRGNVETRVAKAKNGAYDALVLAAAGLLRLGRQDQITTWFDPDQMMPAPGQGALGVQRRSEDPEVEELLAAIEQPEIRRTVLAERAFLARLGSGCSAPVGAWAESEGGEITLHAIVASADGRPPIRLRAAGSDPLPLGSGLAEEALQQGAGEMIGER